MSLQTEPPASPFKRVIAGAVDFLFMLGVLYAPVKLLVFGNIDSELEFTRSGLGQYFFGIMCFVLWLFPYCLRDVFGGRGLG